MYSFMKSIAVAVVLSVAYPAAGAEAAKSPAPPSASASPVFADSFGLSFAERAPLAKQQGSPVPSEPRGTPAADSFGLNDALFSALADCSAHKAGRSAAKLPRCIEM